MVKNPPASADAGSILAWEDPLEEEMATHSSILAWEIPWTEEPGGLQSMESQRVRHNPATKQNNLLFTSYPIRGSFLWQPKGFPDSPSGKVAAWQYRRLRDTGSVPGLGRSPGGGNGNPLQYSCLGNPMDTGAWRATVHRVTKGRPRQSG